MINYRGIQLFNILFGIVIADTVALAITLQSDLYIWPLIILIAAVIAAVVVEFHMLRCPKCHSHRAMNAFGFGSRTGRPKVEEVKRDKRQIIDSAANRGYTVNRESMKLSLSA